MLFLIAATGFVIVLVIIAVKVLQILGTVMAFGVSAIWDHAPPDPDFWRDQT